MGRFYDLALILVATILGILGYYAVDACLVGMALLAIVAVGSAARVFAARVLTQGERTPPKLYLGLGLIYASTVLNVALIALASGLTLAASIAIVDWASAGGGGLAVPEDEVATVSRLLIGAVTGFLGAAFYDEATKPDSALWPPQVFKRFISSCFGGDPRISGTGTPDLYELLYYDGTRQGVQGWRLPAALARTARINKLYGQLPPRT